MANPIYLASLKFSGNFLALNAWKVQIRETNTRQQFIATCRLNPNLERCGWQERKIYSPRCITLDMQGASRSSQNVNRQNTAESSKIIKVACIFVVRIHCFVWLSTRLTWNALNMRRVLIISVATQVPSATQLKQYAKRHTKVVGCIKLRNDWAKNIAIEISKMALSSRLEPLTTGVSIFYQDEARNHCKQYSERCEPSYEATRGIRWFDVDDW